MTSLKAFLTCKLFIFASVISLAQVKNDQSYDTNTGLITTAGGTTPINGFISDFTIGDGVTVSTVSITDMNMLTQGLLQPHLLPGSSTLPEDILVSNNFITPNGDGKNDRFLIEGLQKYPQNTLTIISKSGVVVFKQNNYQNSWDGMYNGKVLNEDGYVYLLDLGKERGVIKGVVNVVLDNY